MKNPRGFRKIVLVPCPRCYAPLDADGVCRSPGCKLWAIGTPIPPSMFPQEYPDA